MRMSTTISIPEAVKEIIHRNRSINECIKMGLINYTALAVRIQPDVEKILRSTVNPNTVVVAIRRYANSLEMKNDISNDESVLKNARLTLTDGIIDINFLTSDFNEIDPGAILSKFSKVTDNYDFFRLSDSFRFLVEDMEDIRQAFSNVPYNDEMLNTGLVKIKISIPTSQNQSDVVSYVTEVLHANGIRLVNAFFSQDSIVIILNEKDSSRAYDALHSHIMRS